MCLVSYSLYDQGSGHHLAASSASDFFRPAIPVSTRAWVPPKVLQGKHPLASSLGFWQDSAPCRLSDWRLEAAFDSLLWGSPKQGTYFFRASEWAKERERYYNSKTDVESLTYYNSGWDISSLLCSVKNKSQIEPTHWGRDRRRQRSW
jgi:hypothetical protein